MRAYGSAHGDGDARRSGFSLVLGGLHRTCSRGGGRDDGARRLGWACGTVRVRLKVQTFTSIVACFTRQFLPLSIASGPCHVPASVDASAALRCAPLLIGRCLEFQHAHGEHLRLRAMTLSIPNPTHKPADFCSLLDCTSPPRARGCLPLAVSACRPDRRGYSHAATAMNHTLACKRCLLGGQAGIDVA